MSNLLLDTLSRKTKPTALPPVWMMRQAGRRLELFDLRLRLVKGCNSNRHPAARAGAICRGASPPHGWAGLLPAAFPPARAYPAARGPALRRPRLLAAYR